MALIVIIDAEVSEIRTLEAALAGLRHRVLITQSAARGLELAQSGNPDLILLNPQNPEMDGIQILGMLKKDPITREIAVALIQKHTDPNMMPRLQQLGVVESFSSSLPDGELKKKILSALTIAERQKLQRTLKRANHINVKRRPGRTDIAIMSGLKEYAFAEARTVFNPFFLKVIKDDVVVLDIRAVPSIPETEVKLLEQMITTLGPKVHVLAGKHLCLLVAETDLSGRIPVFFTQEELDKHLARLTKKT